MTVRPVAMLVMLVCVLAAGVAHAAAIIPSPPQLAAEGYLLIDADTHQVLVEHNSEQRLPPASLTKIMTEYVAANAIQQGTVSLDDMVNVSVKAWRMEGSRMFIREGTQVRLEDLLRGIVIQSGNDASVAVAEHIAGSEEVFADVMNQQAERLGMKNTHFMNATGLPNDNHYTTAHDLALLTMAVISEHPDHYQMYSEKYFTYNDIRQPNRNNLLWRDPSVDGVKTGHTDAAGYCLVASAERDGMRLISVVMGTSSEEARAVESQKLLTYGFRYFETVPLYETGENVRSLRVWRGARSSVDLEIAEEIVLTIPRGTKDSLDAKMETATVLKAPITKGDSLGTLTVTAGDEVVYEGSLVAAMDVPEAGLFSRVWDSIRLFFLELMGGDPLALDD